MLHPTHKARTLANVNVGRGSGLVGICGPGQRVGVDFRVEQHFEGPVVLDAQLVVLVDEDLGEERLVAEPPVRVVAAGVDVGAVRKEAERVVEVGAGVGVVAIVGVETTGYLVQFARDAVLFAFEDAQRDGVGVVSLHEPVLLTFEPVTVRGEPGEFVGFSGHEAVELVMQHPGERVLLCRGDLDALVVVLDELPGATQERRRDVLRGGSNRALGHKLQAWR